MEITRNALFISHATPEDNVFTLWLGAKLSAAGYEVWADVLRLVAGQDWQRILEEALRDRAVKVLMVGTAVSVQKQGVRNEIQIASDTARTIKDKEYIIPLRLEEYNAPFLIVHAQRIDFSKSWAAGLKELLEVLATYKVPSSPTENAALWRAVQLIHGKEPVQIGENLISNWLKFKSLPAEVHHYDFNTGISYAAKKRLLNNFPVPLVAKEGAGFLSFADYPSLQERMPEYPIRLLESIKTEDFLKNGWPSQGIERKDARNHFSDMMRQGLNAVFAAKQLSYYEMSNKKLCWFGEKDVVPESKIRFGWPNSITGLRVIRGFSKKRNMYWHYGFSPQVAMWPEPHIKLRGNLVFSEDGKTAIDDVKKMHRLRRSFTKSWRNARWRDMLMSLLWWITDGADTLVIPFGEEKSAVLEIPTITFTSPVSMPAEIEEPDPEDEDDPDEEEGPFTGDDLDSVVEEVEA